MTINIFVFNFSIIFIIKVIRTFQVAKNEKNEKK